MKHFFEPFFDQEQIKKKNGIFGQNHGLTLLRKKCDFSDFKGINFLSPKKVSFYVEYYETLFRAFF